MDTSMSRVVSPEQGRAEDEAFRASMKELRERKGWSQSQLAEKLSDWPSMNQMTVSRIESGARQPKLTEARAIAALLGTDLNVMLMSDGAAQEALDALDMRVVRLKELGEQLAATWNDMSILVSEIKADLDWLADRPALREHLMMAAWIDSSVASAKEAFAHMAALPDDLKASAATIFHRQVEEPAWEDASTTTDATDG